MHDDAGRAGRVDGRGGQVLNAHPNPAREEHNAGLADGAAQSVAHRIGTIGCAWQDIWIAAPGGDLRGHGVGVGVVDLPGSELLAGCDEPVAARYNGDAGPGAHRGVAARPSSRPRTATSCGRKRVAGAQHQGRPRASRRRCRHNVVAGRYGRCIRTISPSRGRALDHDHAVGSGGGSSSRWRPIQPDRARHVRRSRPRPSARRPRRTGARARRPSRPPVSAARTA